MKSKELKTYNLPSDPEVLYRIDARPDFVLVLIIILGLVSMALKIPYVYGLSMIIIATIAIAYMPRVVMMEFYRDYMVLYNRAEKDLCYLIYYNEVSSWYYAWGANRDVLYIELRNGAVETIEAFSKTLFESQMNRFLKEKRKKISK